MSCAIHSYAEIRECDRWQKVGKVFPGIDGREHEHPFNWQDYGMFGYLAGVRNYSRCETLSLPKGLPADISTRIGSAASAWRDDGHSWSWLSLVELLAFDYDKVFRDRRVEKAGESESQHITYREFLGSAFFNDLEILKVLGKPEDVRVVFWFDS